MGEKSIQKKEYIVEKARDVFARKGFRAVTMKDVVEECDISRGGLYLYFNSTRELFEAVLEKDSARYSAGLCICTRAQKQGGSNKKMCEEYPSFHSQSTNLALLLE